MMEILNEIFAREFFGVPEMTFIIGLLLAVILGMLMGAERELRGKDAGMSTHALVVAGAMLFTFLSMSVDPMSTSRIAAQIVSGIGFLGAGLILKEGSGSVRNLTTAASIWFAGAIGMAIGFGYYMIPIMATVAALIIPRIPHVKGYTEAGGKENGSPRKKKEAPQTKE